MEERKLKRIKLTSLILTVFMLLTVIPFTVSAATSDDAQADLDALTIPSVVFGGYELPTTGTVNGTIIEWEADVPDAVAGDYKTIVAGSVDTEATLTAYAYYGEGEDDYVFKDFNVTIKRQAVVFYDGFDAEVGTNANTYNGWAQYDSSKTGTSFTIEKESEESNNTVLKIDKSATQGYATNYFRHKFDYSLTEKNDFTLSFDLYSENANTVMDINVVGAWEQDDGAPRPDHEEYIVSYRLYYNSNLIEGFYVNPSGNAERSTALIASSVLKTGVSQKFEFQFDYSEQAYWLLIDGVKVTTQPIPYMRRNIYGLGGSLNGTLLGQYGYARYTRDLAIQELWFTHVETQYATGKAGCITIDNVEIATEAPDTPANTSIGVEYVHNSYNNIVCNPKIADKLWRIYAGKENAGKTAIVAVYNSADQLIACPQVTVDENGSAVFNYALDGTGAKNIKAFLWDSTETLKPLSKMYAEEVR